MRLANETINMLCYLTADIQEVLVCLFYLTQRFLYGSLPLSSLFTLLLLFLLVKPFLAPEIVSRLASMLNAVLIKLAGPQGAFVSVVVAPYESLVLGFVVSGIHLKVNNPEKYNFRPRVMLTEVVSTYLHLEQAEAFSEAVASDGYCHKSTPLSNMTIVPRTFLCTALSFRYYNSDVFSKANKLVERMGLLTPEERSQFSSAVLRWDGLVEGLRQQVLNFKYFHHSNNMVRTGSGAR
jgi:hypothetical protein